MLRSERTSSVPAEWLHATDFDAQRSSCRGLIRGPFDERTQQATVPAKLMLATARNGRLLPTAAAQRLCGAAMGALFPALLLQGDDNPLTLAVVLDFNELPLASGISHSRTIARGPRR